jgi:hypothetical protein
MFRRIANTIVSRRIGRARHLGLLALGAAIAWSVAPPLAGADSASCPLPLGRQVQAVGEFAKMMPVFRHPRCANCHGDFDILSDAHTGSAAAKSSGLDPRALLTAAERKTLHAGCDACHDNIRGSLTRLDGTRLSGWLVAPQPMLWNGKSDEQLCKQVKRFERTGAEFVDHLDRDHGEVQFIESAFVGDRALGAALASYGLRVEPPPGTKGRLVALARKWVETLGDGYSASPECGCSIALEGEFSSLDRTSIGDGYLIEMKVDARIAWEPEKGELPSLPTFGDVKSTFFRPSAGEFAVEVRVRSPGIPVGSCSGGGRRTFALSQLAPDALRFMTLELADDGRYKLMLVIPDRPDPFPTWQIPVACNAPMMATTINQDVRDVAVLLGRQDGTLDREDGIVGKVQPPIRRGPREISGSWSFRAATH